MKIYRDYDCFAKDEAALPFVGTRRFLPTDEEANMWAVYRWNGYVMKEFYLYSSRKDRWLLMSVTHRTNQPAWAVGTPDEIRQLIARRAQRALFQINFMGHGACRALPEINEWIVAGKIAQELGA